MTNTHRSLALAFMLLCFTVTLAAEEVARTDPAEFAALLQAYDAALAAKNTDALASLYLAKDARLAQELVSDWQETFARFDALQADSEVRLAGVSGDVALLRFSQQLSGRLAGAADEPRLIREEVSDHLLRRERGSWRFSAESWPVPSVPADLRRVLADASGTAGPAIVELVLSLHAGSWRAVRSLGWRGRVPAPAPTGLAEHVKSAADIAANIHARRQAGTLHLLTQVEEGRFAALPPVWMPASDLAEEELELRRLLDQLEADFANAQLHEQFAQRLEAAGLTDLALAEWQKAAALSPTPVREAAVRRLLAAVKRAATTQPPAAGRLNIPDSAAAPVADARADLVRLKPANVLASEPFLLRLTPDEPLVSEILASLETLHRQMTESFGIPMKQVEVSVFASRQDFNEFRRQRGETGFPLWSGGVSGVDGILTYSRPGVERSIAHEYAHEAIKQFVGGAAVPVWLDEGVAAMVEDMPGPWQEELRRLHQQGRLVPIADLSGPWNALPTELAAGAYAQSRSLAGYLLSTVGREGLLAILTELRRGAGFDQAFGRVLGTDMAGFQQQWLRATFR